MDSKEIDSLIEVEVWKKLQDESYNWKATTGNLEGLKKYEFRSWKINYRGEMLIHAGKGINKEVMHKFEDLNLKYFILDYYQK